MSIRIRPYVPGQDDALWLDIQNRAQDEYPEYTPDTPRDFELRKKGPWFDATGMMLAELDGQPAGSANAHIDRRGVKRTADLVAPGCCRNSAGAASARRSRRQYSRA